MTDGLFVREARLQFGQKLHNGRYELIRPLAVNRVAGIVILYQAATAMCGHHCAGVSR